MDKKHKHAEVIKAWADGAVIEWRASENCEWRVDYAEMPAFDNDTFEFRVKTVEIPEGFTPYGDNRIPWRPELKGYEFLLGDGTIEFRESGAGIPHWATIIAFRPIPNKVVRWQWIVKDSRCEEKPPQMTTGFYRDCGDIRYAISDRYLIIGKAEWTRTEFDK